MHITNDSKARTRLRTLIDQAKRAISSPFTGVYCGLNDPLAHHLGIRVIEQDLGKYDDGHYWPCHSLTNTPTIVMNMSVTSQERKNFTFFHEVTHHIIREDDALYSFFHEVGEEEDFKQALETFCNIGAAEFLLPQEDLFQLINQTGFTVRLIETLDQQFHASLPATCIQLAQCAAHACILVLCEYGSLPVVLTGQMSFGTPQSYYRDCIHVLYAAPSPNFRYNIGRYTPVPDDHLLTQVYRSRGFVQGKDIIPFKSGNRWEVDCEAFYYRGRIFGLFNQYQPTLGSLQLGLL